jgi:hypothetical protein
MGHRPVAGVADLRQVAAVANATRQGPPETEGRRNIGIVEILSARRLAP